MNDNVTNFPKQRNVQPFKTFSPAEWQGRPPPDYDWIVEGCFLRGTVAMLSGDGGLGKSLLMQQLCTATAIGADWLGLRTKPGGSLAIFCEDDADELHRRQENINRHYHVDHAALGAITYTSRAGLENVLMEFDRRTDAARPTPLLEQVRQTALDCRAQILVLDTVADCFAGNEIIRNQVRRFISALRKLAIEMQGVVILTSHPSNAGLASGTGISGSTAWNNSVRSRLYLTKSKTKEDEEERTDERFLKTMKNNQGPYGDRLRLRWDDGVFVRDDGSRGNLIDRLDDDNAVMTAMRYLVSNGTRVTPDMHSRSALCNVLRSVPDCRHLSHAALRAVQDRLVNKGTLVKIELGPPSRRYIYIRPANMLYPGEKEETQ